MPYVETPWGVRIRYDERGPRGARPLVLAHEFTLGLEMWMPQREALSRAYRLITWDVRGHGGSTAPERAESYTMPSLAADLRVLLEELQAADGTVLGGISFGGMVALQYAIDLPERVHALILSDTTTRGDVHQIRRHRPPAELGGDPGLEGGLWAIYSRPDLTRRLPELSVPTLIIFGAEDTPTAEGVQRLIEGLPRRRVVRLAGCGRGTSELRPDAWNDSVLAFLRDVDAGSPLGEDETR